MIKTYQFRLYPTKDQKTNIEIQLSNKRYIYNQYIDLLKNKKQVIPSTKQEHETLKHLKKLPNLPKYKSRYKRNTYSIYNDNLSFDLINGIIYTSSLGKMKVKGYHNKTSINDRILKVTLSKDINQKYYLSITVIAPNIINNYKKEPIVGLDFGIKNLITTSDGKIYENLKVLKHYQNRITLLQQKLSKKKRNSNNFYKIVHQINKTYTKIKNIRNNYIHNITTQLVNKYKTIVTENFNQKDLQKIHQSAINLNDACIYEIIRQLDYKTKWNNVNYIKAPKYYPSSQICNNCGIINKKLKDLSIRYWTCPSCQMSHNRDINAAINIMNLGSKM